MVDIIEAKEDPKRLNQREKAGLERIAETVVTTEFARKWAEREETPKEYRGSSIQITTKEYKPVPEKLLGRLVKKKIVKQFEWNEDEFSVEVSHSEKGVLNVVIDLIGI